MMPLLVACSAFTGSFRAPITSITPITMLAHKDYKDSSAREARKSFLKAAMTAHPDLGGDASQFVELCAEYERKAGVTQTERRLAATV